MIQKKCLISVCLLALVGAGILIGRDTKKMESKCTEKEYSHINPHLACDEKPVVSKASYDLFTEKIKKYIEVEKAADSVTDAAVFFRDLEQGPTFGIKEDERFISASLLKLPVVMTYYKLAESNPTILDQMVQYEKKEGEWTQAYKSTQQSKPMTPYSIRELLGFAVIDSDNDATEALLESLKSLYPNQNPVLSTYRDLGLIAPTDYIHTNDITPRGYASLFRLLYNVSYLDRNYSEELLGLLSKGTFDDGLKAGLPKDIQVANKFGERSGLEGGQKQLHDCGIIYYPDNPYLLCIMTRGYNFKELSRVISNISKMVYEEVDGRRQ